jgi:hypothetical protein
VLVVAAADLRRNHRLFGLLVHPFEQALAEDDEHGRERQDKRVHPRPQARPQDVLEGQLQDDHGRPPSPPAPVPSSARRSVSTRPPNSGASASGGAMYQPRRAPLPYMAQAENAALPFV